MGRINEFFGEFGFFPSSEASYSFCLPSTRILPANFYQFNESVFNRFFEEYAVFLGHTSAEDYIRAPVEFTKIESSIFKQPQTTI